MTQQIRCPGCRLALDVPDDAPLVGLSCPRCLAALGPVTSPAIRPAATPGDRNPSATHGGLAKPAGERGPAGHRGQHSRHGVLLGPVRPLCAGDRVHRRGKPTTLGGAAIASLFLTMVLFGVLDILVIILIVRWLKRKAAREPIPEPGDRFLKGVLLLFTFLGLAAATVVFFFFACLGLVAGM